MDDQMAAWMKYAQPGDAHNYLKSMEGSWKAAGKFWMKPGEPPVEAPGVATNTLILDGRFLQTTYEGDFGGMPFHGMGLDGYDNLNEKYVGIWTDTMSTMMIVFSGSLDSSGKIREMFAEYTSAMTGKPTKSKGVTTVVSENEHRYEGWHMGDDGEWTKAIEIVYTRA